MKKTISTSVLLLLIAGLQQSASAEEAVQDNHFSLTLGGRLVSDTDSAKLEEYRDLGAGLGAADIQLFRDTFQLEVSGDDIGLDSQHYEISGHNYGILKYRVFYDGLPHNFSYGAKSFYSGVGTSSLTYSATNQSLGSGTEDINSSYTTQSAIRNPANWNSFDYSILRENMGFEVASRSKSPFYVKAAANQVLTEGVKPLGQASGVFATRTGVQTSGFGNMVEMPEPVDYTTTNTSLEAGYMGKMFHASISGSMSNFENQNHYLTWRNPYVTSQEFNEVAGLAPDNEYYKIGGEIGWKGLPLRSSIVGQLSYANMNNSFAVRNSLVDAVSGTSSTAPTYRISSITLDRPTFEGDISYTRAGVRLNSRPTKELSTAVYYSHLDKSNDSSRIDFTSGGSSEESEVFDYDKDNAGVDASYKLPMETKLRGGFEWLDVDRKRFDIPNTTDTILSLGVENSHWDLVTAKLGYKHTWREADFAAGTFGSGTGVTTTDGSTIERYLRRFDATDKDRDAFTLGLDFFPCQWADIGVEYTYANNDYKDTLLGRTEDTNHSFYLDSTIRLPMKATINLHAGYETTESDSFHRRYPSSGTFNTNPAAGNISTTNYNWFATLDDDFWTYGIKLAAPFMNDKLRLEAAWDYQDSDGRSNLSYQTALSSTATDLTDVDATDDYKRKLLSLKAIYAFTKQWSLTAGYIYDEFDYNDLQSSGYAYLQPVSSTFSYNSLLTGAYADMSYEESIAYLKVTYSY